MPEPLQLLQVMVPLPSQFTHVDSSLSPLPSTTTTFPVASHKRQLTVEVGVRSG